jgi:hypothetical protein
MGFKMIVEKSNVPEPTTIEKLVKAAMIYNYDIISVNCT